MQYAGEGGPFIFLPLPLLCVIILQFGACLDEGGSGGQEGGSVRRRLRLAGDLRQQPLHHARIAPREAVPPCPKKVSGFGIYVVMTARSHAHSAAGRAVPFCLPNNDLGSGCMIRMLMNIGSHACIATDTAVLPVVLLRLEGSGPSC